MQLKSCKAINNICYDAVLGNMRFDKNLRRNRKTGSMRWQGSGPES